MDSYTNKIIEEILDGKVPTWQYLGRNIYYEAATDRIFEKKGGKYVELKQKKNRQPDMVVICGGYNSTGGKNE